MFNASPQTHLSLTVSDFKHDLQTLSFTDQESFSATFSLDLKRVSKRPALDIENLQPQVLEEGPPSDTRDHKDGDACKKGVCLTEGAAA